MHACVCVYVCAGGVGGGGVLFGLSQFLVMSYEVRYYQMWCLGSGTCLSSAGLFHVVALFDFFSLPHLLCLAASSAFSLNELHLL